MSVLAVIAGAAFRKNLAYFWAHMANAVGSALFGFVYMALWRAAAAGRIVGGFTPAALVGYIALSQVMLWVSVFLPRDLGVSDQVRTGQVAVEFVRPIGYLQRTWAIGCGSAAYGLIFRGLPLVAAFSAAGAFPWHALHSFAQVLLFAAAALMSTIVGVGLQYLAGVAAFWTTDTRWTRRLFYALTMFCGGQLLPIQLMPAPLRAVIVWLPFQSLISLPVSAWLGKVSMQAWVSGGVWCVLVLIIGEVLTHAAARRLDVQGG